MRTTVARGVHKAAALEDSGILLFWEVRTILYTHVWSLDGEHHVLTRHVVVDRE